jgi:Raf kinase inhibitor-like YbhB/YbcL family protein
MFFILLSCNVIYGTPSLSLKSDAFQNGNFLPIKYTCDGKNVSPPLSWSNAPQKTKSFIIICHDPDAPVGTWVHWVLYNIPAEFKNLPEGFGNRSYLPNNIKHGKNSWNERKYGGACPPKGSGVHRYIFTIYALDTFINISTDKDTKTTLEKKIRGHVLTKNSILGRYKR